MSNWFKTMVLFIVLTALLMIVGQAVAGRAGLVAALVVSLGINLFSYWFSDKAVLKAYRAKELSESEAPRVHAVVTQLAQAAGIPKPRVYRIPTDSPNAFATGRNPNHAVVAVTDGILDLLDENELKGVLGHELAHVKHRDILIGSVAAGVASAIMFLAFIARWGLLFTGYGGRSRDGENPLALLVAAIVAPIAATMIQLAISRSREYAADETGAHYAGSPDPLISALKKIHTMSLKVPLRATPATAHMFIMKPQVRSALTNLFSTHPPLEKRIERLNALRG